MGTKYASIAVSGFNSTPPSDSAGDTGASNQLQWAKHINKIGTPLKNAIDSINTSLLTTLDQSARLVFAADNTVAADNARTVQLASTITATTTFNLGDAATMAAGYVVTIANQSATVFHTIGRVTAGDTINGVASNVNILPLESMTFVVNSAANGYLIVSRTGARGYNFLSLQTASASATIDFTANSGGPGFNDNYDSYMIAFSNVKSVNDDVSFAIRVGTGATPTFQTTGYLFSGSRSGVANVANHGSTTDATTDRIPLTGPPGVAVGLGNASGKNACGIIRYCNPETTDFTLIRFESDYVISGSNAEQSVRGSGTGGAQAITGIRFLMSSGNIASGTFRLYGLRKQ